MLIQYFTLSLHSTTHSGGSHFQQRTLLFPKSPFAGNEAVPPSPPPKFSQKGSEHSRLELGHVRLPWVLNSSLTHVEMLRGTRELRLLNPLQLQPDTIPSNPTFEKIPPWPWCWHWQVVLVWRSVENRPHFHFTTLHFLSLLDGFPVTGLQVTIPTKKHDHACYAFGTHNNVFKQKAHVLRCTVVTYFPSHNPKSSPSASSRAATEDKASVLFCTPKSKL